MKAIYVLDEMPEKCEDCQFYHAQINRLDVGENITATQKMEFCRIENPNKPIARYMKQSKPDCCPLKEMPKALPITADVDYITGYNTGWNDCIEHIEEE